MKHATRERAEHLVIAPVAGAAPTRLPTTIAELKDHLRITHDDEDVYLEELIRAAVREYEASSGFTLLNTIYDYRIDRFRREIDLPRAPAVSVTSVKYLNNATPSVETTVNASVYELVKDTEPGYVRLKFDQEWPSDGRGDRLHITIRFTAGYGTDRDAVPEEKKLLIWEQAKLWYDQARRDGPVTEPYALRALRWNNRLPRIG